MNALRDVLYGIAAGMEALGREAGPLGIGAALLVLGYALAWRLLR